MCRCTSGTATCHGKAYRTFRHRAVTQASNWMAQCSFSSPPRPGGCSILPLVGTQKDKLPCAANRGSALGPGATFTEGFQIHGTRSDDASHLLLAVSVSSVPVSDLTRLNCLMKSGWRSHRPCAEHSTWLGYSRYCGRVCRYGCRYGVGVVTAAKCSQFAKAPEREKQACANTSSQVPVHELAPGT